MEEKNIGFYEDPKNGFEISRARTTMQIRSWDFPRSLKALEYIHEELGKADYPGIYLLIDTKFRKIYVGEAKSLYNRLKQHFNNPEDKIKNFERVVIINDGRSSSISEFNDSVVRHSLELYLIKLFKANKYNVVAQGESQSLNAGQRVIVNSLQDELNFFLIKKGLIIKLIEEKGQEEVLADELKKIIIGCGFKIEGWSAYEAMLGNKRTFIRPGSKKSKGWQVTFRDVFKDNLENGDGYLLMPRGNILYIPFEVIRSAIKDKDSYKQNTIDIYIEFKDETVLLHYKKNAVNVTSYQLLKK